MKRFSSSMMYFLRKDAEMIKEVQKRAKEAKETYKPEVAAKEILKEVERVKGLRESYKKTINTLVDREIEEVREKHENQYRSDGHQATISNILKMLELRNFNMSEGQFKNLVAPLIKTNDYITLELLGDIMDSKEQYVLGDYCKKNARQNEVESTEKMLNAINDYINTDILKSIGGDPLKYSNSSYAEICILADSLGFDTTDMNREHDSDNKLVDIEAFMQRQIDTQLGNTVEEPLFKFDDGPIDGDDKLIIQE